MFQALKVYEHLQNLIFKIIHQLKKNSFKHTTVTPKQLAYRRTEGAPDVG